DDVIIERDPDQEKDREIMSKKEAELIVNNSNNGKKYFPDFCTILESNSLEELKKEENKKPDESKLVIIMAKDRAKKNEEKFTHYYRNFKQFCNLINDPKNGVVDTDLNKFVGKLLSKCEVIEIGVRNNMDQAFTMFNSLNSDGLPLTDGDIISARLYGEDPSDDFKNSWQVLLTTLDEIPFINLDAILNQYMYYNRAQNRESDNVKSVRSYYSKDIIADPKGLCEKLIRLVNNWQKASEYPLTKILLKFNSNIRLFFGSFLMRYPTDEIEKNWDDIEDVIKCLIRVFAVLEITEASYSSSFFKHKLISENFRLSDPSIPVKDIIADFQKMINEDMSKKWNRNTILDSLKDYSSSTEKMLVYLNEYLFFQEHFAQDPDKQFEITEDCEVEHIAPSKGRGSFTTRKSYGIEDKDEYNKLVNLLGNKILLEPRINRAIGADWFSTKLVYYEKSTYPIAQHIADKKAAFFDDESKTYKWNQKNIEDATDKAAERITDFIFSF
ncbi:MAG: HNH endonuclease, partial [Abditibacteriota bacterium]|nr:HNH endonuclease [Abditibacteriota bacterium]